MKGKEIVECVYVCTHVHRHTKWNIIKQQKEGNPAICDNMNGLRGHYA